MKTLVNNVVQFLTTYINLGCQIPSSITNEPNEGVQMIWDHIPNNFVDVILDGDVYKFYAKNQNAQFSGSTPTSKLMNKTIIGIMSNPNELTPLTQNVLTMLHTLEQHYVPLPSTITTNQHTCTFQWNTQNDCYIEINVNEDSYNYFISVTGKTKDHIVESDVDTKTIDNILLSWLK